jgi:hypothetical protein
VICGLTGRKLPLHGGGRAEKSYIHNRDLARAIHMVAEKAPLGAVYNAGSSARSPNWSRPSPRAGMVAPGGGLMPTTTRTRRRC